MKKKFKKAMSFLFAFVMGFILCVPAFSAEKSTLDIDSPTLSIDLNSINFSTQHYEEVFVEDGTVHRLELSFEPAASPHGSSVDTAYVGTWTSSYSNPAASMSYKFDLTYSNSQWKISNAREHAYSGLFTSFSNPSLTISRATSTSVFPAEINGTVTASLFSDIIYSNVWYLTTTVASDGTLTMTWN